VPENPALHRAGIKIYLFHLVVSGVRLLKRTIIPSHTIFSTAQNKELECKTGCKTFFSACSDLILNSTELGCLNLIINSGNL
jgi:hypothetical protein